MIRLPPRDLPKLRLAARAWAKRPKRLRTLGRLPSIPLAIEAGYVLRLRQLAARTAETLRGAVVLRPLAHHDAADDDEALKRALAGLDDAELDYLRGGMRPLDAFHKAYEGLTPAQANAVSTGVRGPFDPIKLLFEDGRWILEDGRHRLAAARAAGATHIRALVNGQEAVIPIPSGVDPASAAETLRSLGRGLTSSGETAPTARMLENLNEHNRAAMNRFMAPVTGDIPIWRGTTPEVRAVLDDALRANVRLIKSIPEELLDDVERTLREHLAAGSRVETIQKALKERYAIGERRAALIARDQVGKVNAQLNEERSTDIGMDSYTWRCSGGGGPEHGDERVRPGHRALDGTKQTFGDPPVVDEKSGRHANPGEDFQCRCTAESDVSGYLDAIGA
jgi:SPP1 gp7 family putative phage head morphogenesis protein